MRLINFKNINKFGDIVIKKNKKNYIKKKININNKKFFFKNHLNFFFIKKARKLSLKSRKTFSNKKLNRQVYVFIKQSYNNIFSSIYKLNGYVLWTCSSGKLGFKGSKKLNNFSSKAIGRSTLLFLKCLKIRKIILVLKSPSTSIVKSFLKGLCDKKYVQVRKIFYKILISHNGLRNRKERRV